MYYFVDSYRLLPNSLNDLGKAWGCKVQKGTFPYKFVNKDNLNYIGPTPMAYYEGEKPVYSDNWNMEQETITYLNADIMVLYQVLEIFNDVFYTHHKISAITYVT